MTKMTIEYSLNLWDLRKRNIVFLTTICIMALLLACLLFPIVDATTSQARNPTPTSTYVSTSTDTIFRVSQGINGYARGITTSTSQKSLVTVLQQTPVSGNMLILTYGTYKGGAITSVTQTGVTWTLQKATVAYGVMDIEIWAGVVGNGASTSITVSWTYAASGGAVVDVCEYSGLLTSNFLDKTASASGNSATLATGTTALTSQAEELFVGAIFTSNSIPNQGKATNGFTLLDGVHYALGIDGSLGYLEKISSVAETASSTVTASSTFWGGCIATFKASSSISPSPTPTPTLTPTSTPTPTSSPIPTPSATPRPTTSTDTIFRVSQGINGYARGITTSTSQKSLVTVLQQTPVSGNMLILTYGTYKGGAITSVTQTGVTWTLQKATVAYGVMDIEIWAGVVGNGASTSITVSWTYAASGGAVVDVCEYSGLLTSNFLDKTASASGNSATLATGTTALTSQAEELFVGAIFTSNSIPNQGKATNGFTLLDGVHYALGIDGSLGYLEKISSVAETASSTVTASSTFWGGCIATFKASSSISPSPTPTPTLTPTSTPTPRPTSSPAPIPTATSTPTPTLSPTPPPTQTPYGGTSKYNNNAVWLGEANDPIGTNLQGLISTLTANHIKYAVIMVGYWNAANPAAPTINPHFHPISYYSSVCTALKNAGIVPIAWVEGGVSWGESRGTPNITPAYYAAYNARVAEVMAVGFSGYSEDIETWTGTQTQYIAYLNQQNTFLDGLNKLCMPAVSSNNGGNNINQYLHVDYILSMFYWTSSLFEQPDADIYWQEEFGLGPYHSTFGTSGSPILFGLDGVQGNQNPMSWQLSQFTRCLNTYGSDNLAGIALWTYDFMNTAEWNNWASWNQA